MQPANWKPPSSPTLSSKNPAVITPLSTQYSTSSESLPTPISQKVRNNLIDFSCASVQSDLGCSPSITSTSSETQIASTPRKSTCSASSKRRDTQKEEDVQLLRDQENMAMRSFHMIFREDNDEGLATPPLGSVVRPGSLGEFTAGLVSDGLGGSMPHPKTKAGSRTQPKNSPLSHLSSSRLDLDFEYKFQAGLLQDDALGGSSSRVSAVGANHSGTTTTPIKGHRSTPLNTPLLEEDVSEVSSTISEPTAHCYTPDVNLNDGVSGVANASFEIENCSFHDSSDDSFFDSSFHGIIPGLELFGGVDSDMEVIEEEDEYGRGRSTTVTTDGLKPGCTEGSEASSTSGVVSSVAKTIDARASIHVLGDQGVYPPGPCFVPDLSSNSSRPFHETSYSALGFYIQESLPLEQSKKSNQARKETQMMHGPENQRDIVLKSILSRPPLRSSASRSLDFPTKPAAHPDPIDYSQDPQGRPRSSSAPTKFDMSLAASTDPLGVLLSTTSNQSNISPPSGMEKSVLTLNFNDLRSGTMHVVEKSPTAKPAPLVRHHSSSRISQPPSANLTPIIEIRTPPLGTEETLKECHGALVVGNSADVTVVSSPRKIRIPHTIWTPDVNEFPSSIQTVSSRTGINISQLNILGLAPALFFSTHPVCESGTSGDEHPDRGQDVKTAWRTKENKISPILRSLDPKSAILPGFLKNLTQLPEPIPRTRLQQSGSPTHSRPSSLLGSRQPVTSTHAHFSTSSPYSAPMPQGPGSAAHIDNNFHFERAVGSAKAPEAPLGAWKPAQDVHHSSIQPMTHPPSGYPNLSFPHVHYQAHIQQAIIGNQRTYAAAPGPTGHCLGRVYLGN
ncbi:hypothetical protein FRC02_007531 [Tulasnella sp. 418]|nr:hypothetical protein FRC02_007531 [Tulasnella sp. 418]